jgi:hypothetical protein
MIKNWKNISILVLLAALLVAAGTSSNNWYIGDGAAGDKSIVASNADANKPALKYDDTADKWQFSNDGTSFTDMGGGGGGGTYAATYGETIAAGDALEVRSDGKLYKLSNEILNFPSINTNSLAQDDDRYNSVGYDPSSDLFIAFGTRTGSQIIASVVGKTDKGETYFYGKATFSATSLGLVIACTDYKNNRAIAFGKQGTNIFGIHAKVVDGQVVFENYTTQGDGTSFPTSSGKCLFDSNRNKPLLTYKNSGGPVQVRYYDIFPTPNLEANVQVNATTNLLDVDMDYDPDNDRFVIAIPDGVANNLILTPINTTSGSPVIGTPQNIANSTNFGTIAYDRANNGWAAVTRQTTLNACKITAFSLSGDTITVNNQVACSDTAFQFGMSSAFSAITGKIYSVYSDGGVSSEIIDSYESNGTDILNVNQLNTYSLDNGWNTGTYGIAANELGELVFTGFANNAITAHVINQINGPIIDNFVAIANESGVLNDTKDVTLGGQLHGGFSGKTAGDYAYLQNDGTISELSFGKLVGVFVSPTELVFNNQKSDFEDEPLHVRVPAADNTTVITGGFCDFYKVKKLVTVSCGLLNHSSNTGPSTGVNFVPVWARPVNTYGNMYLNTSSLTYYVRVTGQGRINFFYRLWTGANPAGQTNTGQGFTISYYVD